MREIKFRAWNKANKEMFKVSSLGWNLRKVLNRVGDHGTEQVGVGWISENIELMQFTGLHDRNGTEIYEGDIIKFGKISLIVEWSETISSFMGRPNGKLRDWPSLTEHSAAKHGVILGNIYENKELLEAEG